MTKQKDDLPIERIDMRDDEKISHWMKRLSVSRADLAAAVSVVGPDIENVHSYFEQLRR